MSQRYYILNVDNILLNLEKMYTEMFWEISLEIKQLA